MSCHQLLYSKIQLHERREIKNPNPLLQEAIFIWINLYESLKLNLESDTPRPWILDIK